MIEHTLTGYRDIYLICFDKKKHIHRIHKPESNQPFIIENMLLKTS